MHFISAQLSLITIMISQLSARLQPNGHKSKTAAVCSDKPGLLSASLLTCLATHQKKHLASLLLPSLLTALHGIQEETRNCFTV